MTDIFALLFAATMLGAFLMIVDAMRAMAHGARLLLGPHGLAAQSHYRIVTIRRTATAIISPVGDRPQGPARRRTPSQGQRRTRPTLVPARCAAA